MKEQKYWVSMTDNFMSGWGGADNRTNKLVIECDNMEEAEIVKENAEDHKEMKYINICIKKPYYRKCNTETNYHDKTDYPSWFIPGYFHKRRNNG